MQRASVERRQKEVEIPFPGRRKQDRSQSFQGSTDDGNEAPKPDLTARENGQSSYSGIAPSQKQLQNASQARQYERETFKIPVCLKIDKKEISGYTHDISLAGLLFFCDISLFPGAPMNLHFSFGDICYLNIAGQVVFCISVEGSASGKYAIGIKFSAIRDFEQKILISAIEELKRNISTQERSLLNIIISEDALALEAADFSTIALQELDGKIGTFLTPSKGRNERKLTTRRVVITGIGAVAPNGIGREAFWKGLEEGKNCVDRISFFDPSGHSSQVAAEIRDFDPKTIIPAKEVKRMGRSAHLGIAAAQLAVIDGDLALDSELESRIAVIIGTGTSGIEYVEEDFYWLRASGVGKMRPYTGIAAFGGALSSEISRALRLTGPSLTISTGCTGAIDAMGYAMNMIRYGLVDISLTGGADAAVSPGILGAFCQMGAVATRFNDVPKKASRPFNKDRDGFVISEGGWVFIFEELHHALRRGAKIYGEIAGYASTCDAHHMSRPLPSGQYTAKAMKLALLDAMVQPFEIDYINAYGNSTHVNDSYETMVIKQVFGDHAYKVMISSTKSMIGHAIGACGAAGVAATLLAISEGIVPPTINYEWPDPECDLDYVPNVARRREVKIALCNTLAFGSKNAVMVLRKFDY